MIHKIKALYDGGNGLTIRALARKLGISRNTVKKYLHMKENELQQQQDDRSRNKRLDEHREYIIHLLETFPQLSAVKVLRKLKEKQPELQASDRSARRYISELKETLSLKQKRYYEPVLDMVPGVQCQVDGSELRGVLVRGVETVIYFVVFVLSYSRMMYVGLSKKAVDTDRFIKMHDEAFRYFDGRPDECVYDQAKLVVLHEQYRELDLNPRFHAYATAAGFGIRACEGYDPESKGKVEAGVKYVKNNGLYGEHFDDWKHLETHMRQWLAETANQRNHGTTHEAPRVRYERDEKRHMGHYLSPDYLKSHAPQETRKVDKTGLISWKSNKYSVPMLWQQSRVGVREEGMQLVISALETNQEITRHENSQGKGDVLKNTDHYRNKQEQIAELEMQIRQYTDETHGQRLCALLKHTQGKIYKDQLVGFKTLLKRYEMPLELRVKLCDRSTLTSSQIRDYLEAYHAQPERFKQTHSESPKGNTDTLSRPLEPYADIAQNTVEAEHEQLH